MPLDGAGSPEFYHTAGSWGCQPPATYWANLMPHTGNGMSAFVPWYWTNINFREYIQTSLTSPLVVGETYKVGFWLTNGFSTIHPFGVNHIGVAFSMAPLVQFLANQIVYTPQIELPGVIFSTTWEYHTMTFTAAQPFQYICFGSFVPWGAMTYQALGASGFSGSLYYIDDISVELATSLPIELLSFDAECESGATQLHWTTASEHNSDHFEVERSEDILDWQVIGTLTGAGNSQQTIAYSFTDPEHFDTTVYYRFKEIDTDGPFSYSPVVASTTCGDEAPIHQWVLDAMGRICGTWPVTDGRLSAGVYLVRSEYSNGKVVVRKVAITQD